MPRQLVYFAIDGVAPAAKNSCQRSHRFLKEKETKENEKMANELYRDLGIEK